MSTVVFIFNQNNFPRFVSRKELLNRFVVANLRIFDNVFEISFSEIPCEITVGNFFFELVLKFLFIGIF